MDTFTEKKRRRRRKEEEEEKEETVKKPNKSPNFQYKIYTKKIK